MIWMERRKQLEDLDYVSNIKLVNIKLSIKVSHFKLIHLIKKPLKFPVLLSAAFCQRLSEIYKTLSGKFLPKIKLVRKF